MKLNFDFLEKQKTSSISQNSNSPRNFINYFLNNWKTILLYVIATISFIIGIDYYYFSFVDNPIGIGILLSIISFFLLKIKNNPITKPAIVFSFIFSFILFIGKPIYYYNDISWLLNFNYIILSIISIFGFTTIIGIIISSLFNFFKKIDNTKTDCKTWAFFSNRFSYVYIWLIILLAWLPALRAYFPGNFTYDAPYQLWQIPEPFESFESYNKFHPPLHTMLLHLSIILGKHFKTSFIAIYSIFQMVFISGVMSAMVGFMVKKKVNNWVILASLLLVTINPLLAIISITTTKDVMCAGFMILLVLELIDLSSDPEKYLSKPVKFIYFAIISTLTCLFRNNAIYAFTILTPIVCIILKPFWKKALILLMIPIIMYHLINNCIYDSMGIKHGEVIEMCAVPLQQIANAVVNKTSDFDTDTVEEIRKFMPYDEIIDKYNPRFADPVKLEQYWPSFDEHLSDFIKLWFKIFKQYPKEYISAALTLNIPYWYPGADTIDCYANRMYLETNTYTGDKYEKDENTLKLQKFYEDVASFKTLEKNPITATLCSLAFPIWFLLFSLCLLIHKGFKTGTIALLPLIFLWLTHLLGPVSNFRYIIPIFITYPILFSLIFNSSAFFKRETERS